MGGFTFSQRKAGECLQSMSTPAKEAGRSLRILIAPDKYKGTLTAGEAAEAIRLGWLDARPLDKCQCVPLSDGGEGLLEVFQYVLPGSLLSESVRDPLGRAIQASWYLAQSAEERLAVIETSQACGLQLLTPRERNPLIATTHGVGDLLQAAKRSGATRIIAGLGGSGTNDGGTGMAAAIGYAFLDKNGRPLSALPRSLVHLAAIRPPHDLSLPSILAATDVVNPLTGPNGATRVYGPQKGLRPEDSHLLEDGLENLATVVQRDLSPGLVSTPGSGAAGGLGFGFQVFCRAELRSGFQTVSGALELEKHISACDLVITGEGSLDVQSLQGKAPVALARLCQRLQRAVIALPGRMDADLQTAGIFQAVLPLTKIDPFLETALPTRSAHTLRAKAREAAENIAGIL